MTLPKRKQIRLPDHDYSAPGAYFITICTENRRCILSEITVGEGLAPPETRLSVIGQCVEEQIHQLPRRYQTVDIEKYVIMPNHVHLLVTLREGTGGASPSPTLFDVVRVLKSMTTRLSRPALGDNALWQRSYHEHIIRDEHDFSGIWNYIDGNPSKWLEDRYYEPQERQGKSEPEARR